MRIFLLYGRNKGGNVINGAGFVIYVHDADKAGVFVYPVGKNFRQDSADTVNGTELYFTAALLQQTLAIEYGVVLRRRNNDLASGGSTKKRRIVTFGSAGGKKQLLRPAV